MLNHNSARGFKAKIVPPHVLQKFISYTRYNACVYAQLFHFDSLKSTNYYLTYMYVSLDTYALVVDLQLKEESVKIRKIHIL